VRKFEIAGNPGPGKWLTNQELTWQIGHLDATGLALFAANLVQGEVGLWKFSIQRAAAAVGASYGYTNVACRLPYDARRSVGSGQKSLGDFYRRPAPPADDAVVLQYIRQHGVGRLVTVVNNRCQYAVRLVAAE
jgi:hypothetical protein